MYKIFMLIAIPALAIGWVVYLIWDRKMREEEKKQPKQESQRLTKTKSEVSDWAKKMVEYQPPKIKKKYSDEESQEPQQEDQNKQE